MKMPTLSIETLPPFQQANVVELNSLKDSKISGVSVYAGRAEVTRVFRFGIKTGQNQVNISGLPNALDWESVRVEGRGAATIHDVTISTIPIPPAPTSSQELKALLLKQESTQKALSRCKQTLQSLGIFLGTLSTRHVTSGDLGALVDNVYSTAGKFDDRVSEMEAQLLEIDEEIKLEREKISGPTSNEKLNIKASIGVFADFEGEVEIALIYAVYNASWYAGYDIRVDMETKEKSVTLIYKGAITQNTGEDWEDVPLTLETAAPTFGLGVPTLDAWTLSTYRPPTISKKYEGFKSFSGSQHMSSAEPYIAPTSPRYSPTSPSFSPTSPHLYAQPIIVPMSLPVSSTGNVSATFSVPGRIAIPSDAVSHNVTITTLQLDAAMTWLSVPKKDPRTHLTAKIKNASEYTLLSGKASVYVNGSFISRSDVPAVSPEESFDCPLGLDPSIRITYQPSTKKLSQAGFLNKASNHVYFQRVTVFNSKSTAIDNLKITDQVPISEDALVTVKLISPSLTLPSKELNLGGVLKTPGPLNVSAGVVAQWYDADEPETDVESLGKDGKFNWVCSIPALGKINLLLQWEVSAPVRTTIVGL